MATTIIVPEKGVHELDMQFKELSKWCVENFGKLYEGATRLGLNIVADYYAPERISINKKDRSNERDGQTRIHRWQGLKYAGGYKYNSDDYPVENDIITAIEDINMLLEAYGTPVKSKITIVFPESEKNSN